MKMLEAYAYDDKAAAAPLAVFESAKDVKINREINGAYNLYFTLPNTDKAEFAAVNAIIKCEGQLFRVIKSTRRTDGTEAFDFECSHVYNEDAQRIHIQNIPDYIGKSPYRVLREAFEDTPFTLLSAEECTALGMKRIDADSFKIDWFSTDKLTPYEVMQQVIENCGKGEIYVDNYKIALVEHIGNEKNVKLDISRNMQDLTIEKDISGLVTRLYPYGADDVHIGTVNSNIQYVDSPNISIYGVREGFKDYTDYSEPADIKALAKWEFSAENEERIDIPSLNISGQYVDISKLTGYEHMHLDVGDTVIIYDNGTEYRQRVIQREYYPYEPELGSITIGRVKRDMFFYMNQMYNLVKRYTRDRHKTN